MLGNSDIVIYNFRKELVERLLEEGYKVYVSSPYGPRIDKLIDMGCKFEEVSINRHGTNVFEDFKLLLSYKNIIKKIEPDVVLSYTIKPNVYGGVACQLTKTPYIANITGLGTAVENEGIMQKVTIFLYKIAFRKVHKIFLQNLSNQEFLMKYNIRLNKHKLIPGSGVNLKQHKFENYPEKNGVIKFLYIGRVMRDKGIGELIEAAKIIKDNYDNVEFHAIGFFEDDYINKISEFEKMNIIKFHGMKKDVHSFIKSSNAVILPSYHEGMSNALLEAASTGRPILASDIHGCKETFDEGISGLGFKVKNVNSLVETIEKFINLPYKEKKKMGKMGRKKMEKEFDRNIVVDAYMEEIENILEETGGK